MADGQGAQAGPAMSEWDNVGGSSSPVPAPDPPLQHNDSLRNARWYSVQGSTFVGHN